MSAIAVSNNTPSLFLFLTHSDSGPVPARRQNSIDNPSEEENSSSSLHVSEQTCSEPGETVAQLITCNHGNSLGAVRATLPVQLTRVSTRVLVFTNKCAFVNI